MPADDITAPGADVTPRADAGAIAAAAALACELPAEGVARRAEDTAQLFARARERRALPDGASLVFPGDDDTARALFAFVTAERRCCPRLTYELAFVPDHTTVRLTLRGLGAQIDGIRAWASVGP